jgi:hypothetical protein
MHALTTTTERKTASVCHTSFLEAGSSSTTLNMATCCGSKVLEALEEVGASSGCLLAAALLMLG